MHEISFQDIPGPYKSMKKCIQHPTLQKIYSMFTFYFIQISNFNENYLNQNQDLFKTFIINNIKNHMFITYQISSILNNKFKSDCHQFQSDENINATFCVENKCIIIEEIHYNLISEIIKNLQNLKKAIINTNIDFKTNKESREEEQAKEEIGNFCKNFQKEIKQNEFINFTIYSIIGYLIRRYFYPTNYFNNHSFFTFDQLKNIRPNCSKTKLKNCLFSFDKQKILSVHNDLMELIKETKNSDENSNSINNFEFNEKDFIKLRTLYSSGRSSILLVIHLKSLYLFALKKGQYINERSKEFQHELYFCKNYSHQSLTKFYGFLKERDEIIGFIYEFMSNNSLSSYVLTHPNEINEIFSLMTINRIFQGIDYLHSNLLIYRDLKPSNILLDHDFLPYISDFETIRQLDSEFLVASFDFASQLYASPEQIKGESVSYKSDIYSFGLIVYFLIKKTHFKSNQIVNSNETNCDIHTMEILSNNFETMYELCIQDEPEERPTNTEIKNFIISEVNLFVYFIHYLQQSYEINESLLVNYFFECIKIQKELNDCRENMFFFYILFHSFISKKIDFSFLFHVGNLYKTGTTVKQDYLKMKEIFQILADKNNSNALVGLGDCYYTGNGIKQDYIKAKEYYELAAKQNNSNAFLNLGNMYKKGIGVKQDYFKAREYYELSSLQNNSEALLNLGIIYELGNGVEQNYSKAKQYYELSAQLGNSCSLLNIGNLFYSGNGVKQNYIKAKEYYEYSSKYGNDLAFLNLGYLYYYGYGVKQDYVKAKEFFEFSAKHNNSDAILNIGILYEHGFGVKQDYLEAKKYYQLSANYDNSVALLNLGILYENALGVDQDYLKAKEYYELSSKLENSNAFLNLGNLYIHGYGVEKDYMKAKTFYEQSAQLNNSDALLCLANIYSYGYGVKQDYFIARHYLESASLNKNSLAFFNLGLFYTFGYGVDIDYSKAKQYYELSAKLNNSNAEVNLGVFYFYGFGVEINYSKAKHYFEMSVIHNNSEGLIKLGNIYSYGLGVEKNYLKAKSYYEKAFQMNNIKALLNLGSLYLNGLGVNRDYLRAKYYFEIASKHNNSYAFLYLGDLYFNGLGVNQNYLKAKEYYDLAAQLRNSISYFNLGFLYYNGFGVDKDFGKAKRYFELSAMQNDSEAYLYLGHLYFNGYGVDKDYSKAKKYYESSAQLHNSSSFFYLSKLYSSCEFFELDLTKVITYLLKCREIYNDKQVYFNVDIFSYKFKYNIYRYSSSNDLGLIYLTIFQDIEKATDFIKESAFGEYPFAQNNFGLLNQLYFNKFGNAKYMYERAAKHKFALSEYNIGYMFEINDKLNESIEYYIKACEHEDEPLIFYNYQHNDKQLEISKIFILTFTKLKLLDYFFSISNYIEAKKYFISSFSKLENKIDTYKFQFKFHKNSFSYLKEFIFNFPLFNLAKHQFENKFKIKANIHKQIEINQKSNKFTEININSSNVIPCKEKIAKNESETFEAEANNKKLCFNDFAMLFNFILTNEKYKMLFIKEIRDIINEMKMILYTQPYSILFGRINIEKPKPSPKKVIQEVNLKFYEGFGLQI